MTTKELNHGVYTTYTGRGCRCDLCKKAAAEYRKQRKEKINLEGEIERLGHGDYRVYFYGCRCELCCKANTKKHKEWVDGNREEVNKYHRNWSRENSTRYSEIKWKSHLKYKYDLTLEEYESMQEIQDGRCYICDSKARLCVDHNHDTGEVRKLLCDRCNTQLGIIENAEFLEKALAYLEEHGNVSSIESYY